MTKNQDPARTSDVPAFRPWSWYEDCCLLFPISPVKPGRDERERVEESHERFELRMRVRVVR